jgi:hypothetical protein
MTVNGLLATDKVLVAPEGGSFTWHLMVALLATRLFYMELFGDVD